MAKIGFSKKLYLQVDGSDYTMLKGETSSSFNLSADTIEVSDKETSWKKYVAGYKGGTVDATIYADAEDAAQKHLISAIFEGGEVKGFIGELGSGSTPVDGYAFSALVTSIGETYDTGNAIARSISLQITGEVTTYPTL
jgi:predicted secreted protein